MTLDFEDIQGIVVSGYAHLSHAGYLMVQVSDPALARGWIAAHLPELTNAVKPPKDAKPIRSLNLAVTYAGLEALGLPARDLDLWPEEFSGGPAEDARARMLGDTCESAPDKWDFGALTQPTIHLMILFFGVGEAGRDSYAQELLAGFAAGGLTLVYYEPGNLDENGLEHFGFADGMSQPSIAGLKGVTPGDINPGEFLFGHLNEYGLQSAIPGSPQLGRNGTYLVFRKLAQDVEGFENYLKKASHGDPARAEYIGAKIVGRWRSGAPLVLAPESDNPAYGSRTEHNNDFLYAEADPHGLKCPVGAHIRRANPRDSLEPNPAESMKTIRRHSILRRGRNYGTRYNGSNGSDTRGLIFIAINSDIKRQFEFIQQAWTNDPSFNGLVDNKDPLIGDRTKHSAITTHTIPHAPYAQQLLEIPQFVTTRGALYGFLPGLAALRYIAGL